MKKGFISQYFQKIATKRLSAVEVDTERSNQHEFNGSKPLRELFGKDRLNDYPVNFIWLGGENEGATEDSFVTWYDARKDNPNRASEFRLYFKNNTVMELANEGDLLIIAKRPSSQIYIIIVSAETTFENQILWLFDITDTVNHRFSLQSMQDEHDHKVDFATKYILEEIGIEIDETDTELLDYLLQPYIKSGFPTTKEFSKFARETTESVDSINEPDMAIIKWIDQEEKLFKRLERHVVSEKLERIKNEVDVDGLLSFSLSVQNRRKSRAGLSLENHLEEIFIQHEIKYSRNQETENKSRPDFLFPGVNQYHQSNFPASRLTMLGVKSTCKDRWRQVLTEARRIKDKHLFTLEPSISINQTEEMKYNSLQLVLPKSIHSTFKETQRKHLLSLESFLNLIKSRE